MTKFTYEAMIGKALVGEPDVQIEYQGGPWGWSVEVEDLRTGTFVTVGRDDTDKIMTWAWDNHADELHEMMRSHNAGAVERQRMDGRAA